MNKLASSLPASMPAVIDPAGTGENFTDRYGATWNYANFRARLVDYASKIDRAYVEPDRDMSTQAWSKIFGDAFKPTHVTKAVALSETVVRASAPHAGERFIDQAPYSFPIRLNIQYRARVQGRVTGYHSGGTRLRNGFRTFELAKNGNRVPKNCSIAFTVVTDVPAPYDVYWKVRNGGSEAARANCLRGEITHTNSHNKSEPTAYAGYHYVEVYIVRSGVVVAKDRQEVIVT
jgi:hypothetical protein